jgi:hypothetical protein
VGIRDSAKVKKAVRKVKNASQTVGGQHLRREEK